MATFPFQNAPNSNTFIKTVCHLYRISVFKILPISLLLILIYDFIRFGDALYPKEYVNLHFKIVMFPVILILPLIGTLFCILDAIGKEQPIQYRKILIYSISRFISLMGCIFSMLVFPGFVFLICLGVLILLAIKKFSVYLIFAWLALSMLAVFGAFVSKILAPVLVFSDEQNANDAVDNSEQMVKGYYIRTFIYSFYAVLLLIFLAEIPYMAKGYVHSLKQLSPWILEGVSQILLLLIGPWSFALFLTQKYDLQSRFVPKTSVKPKLNIKSIEPKTTTEGSKEDKLNF